MGLAGGDGKRNIEAIAIFALLLSFASFSFVNLVTRPVACFPGDIGTVKCPLQPGTHDLTSLGTWTNMPPSSSCGAGNTSASICELLGNSSYRAAFTLTVTGGGSSGVQVGLTVGCLLPSNTIGANLQLQYATYSVVTQTNSTNFVNVGSSLLIDNSANNPCPGNLISSTFGSLGNVNTNPAIVLFRVVGIGGGGTGDNPRFSSVQVVLSQQSRRTPLVVIGTSTATSFTYQAQEVFPVVVATPVTIKWEATNITSAGCGINTVTSLSLHCWEAGTSSATIAIGTTASPTTTVTFTTAFSGTVQAIASGTGGGAVIAIPIGTVSLLSAQTLTV